jgi:hypothetical protein
MCVHGKLIEPKVSFIEINPINTSAASKPVNFNDLASEYNDNGITQKH